ncbi:P-loop containing nucleoside triphosphate hydrolase protein [Gigaspora margarita]|uniref:P-loop containing nucleoside triphosphate hydrolase protein n=1 Tax=Gigaspora margarita TaxID=4874 RepID=A0A8H3X358_GIGMA|nr:P-loop containing nucleoside triphosphate hydrolase protein [Gigaspora margarita]
MYKGQGKPCRISRIVTIPEKVPHNDELLGDLESIHHTFMLYICYKFSETFVDVELAREMKLKFETIVHDSLQMLKIPRKRCHIVKVIKK